MNPNSTVYLTPQTHTLLAWAQCFRIHKSRARKALFAIVKDARTNHSTARPITKLMSTTLEIHRCSHCEKAFPTKQQKTTHEFTAHHSRSPLYGRFVGKHCCACLLNFSHPHAMWEHVLTNKGCTAWYHAFAHEEPQETVAAEHEEHRIQTRANVSKGKPRYFAPCVAGRLPGPLPRGAPARVIGSANRYYD